MEQPNARKQSIFRRMFNASARESPKEHSIHDSSNDTRQHVAPSNTFNVDIGETDRNFMESSGEEDEDNFEDDDFEGGMCINLNSDDDDQTLDGFHIDLKTLQAVSSMLAHYVPVIQSDRYGNPTFVPPPPPPEEDYYEEDHRLLSQTKSTPIISKRLASTKDEDYQYAIQELEDVLQSQDSPNHADPMTELSDVMEKMSRFTEEIQAEE